MSDTRKLAFTLPNGATFSAEGTEAHVEKLFEQFRALLETTPNTTPAKPAKTADSGGGAPVPDGQLPLERLFSQDDYYGVALLAKPKTDNVDADGLLAVLYGFAVLRKETTVTALRLQRAAEKSGLDTPRLGRVIMKHTEFVTESGKGKGKKYGLNNPGSAKAVEILKGILG